MIVITTETAFEKAIEAYFSRKKLNINTRHFNTSSVLCEIQCKRYFNTINALHFKGRGQFQGSEKTLQRERFFLREGSQPLRVFAVFAFGFSLINY